MTTHDTHRQGGGTAEALWVSSPGALLPTLVEPGETVCALNHRLVALRPQRGLTLFPVTHQELIVAPMSLAMALAWYGLLLRSVPLAYCTTVCVAVIVYLAVCYHATGKRCLKVSDEPGHEYIWVSAGESWELAARRALLDLLLRDFVISWDRIRWLAAETLDVSAQDLERSVRGLTQNRARAVALVTLLGNPEYRGPAVLVIRTLANTARADQRQLACTCLDKLHARYTADQEAAAQERAARRAVEKAAGESLEPDLSDVFDLIINDPNPIR